MKIVTFLRLPSIGHTFSHCSVGKQKQKSTLSFSGSTGQPETKLLISSLRFMSLSCRNAFVSVGNYNRKTELRIQRNMQTEKYANTATLQFIVISVLQDSISLIIFSLGKREENKGKKFRIKDLIKLGPNIRNGN